MSQKCFNLSFKFDTTNSKYWTEMFLKSLLMSTGQMLLIRLFILIYNLAIVTEIQLQLKSN